MSEEKRLCDSLREEKRLCDDLRRFCDRGVEKDRSNSARIFHKLGLINRKRSPEKVALIQSAVLLNAAIVRKPGNIREVTSDLQELCCHVLDLARAEDTRSDLVKISRSLQQKVLQFRISTNHNVNRLTAPPITSHGEFSHFKVQRAGDVERLQNGIAEEFTALMKEIMGYCIRIKGPAPCRYALVGMGSLARREVTPYSDFENIIVLQDGIQHRPNYKGILEYFRWIAVIFQLIIVNFGETIIPCMNLPYLNNFMDREKNWFYDAFTPRGISFDGQVPYACKSPLGRPSTERRPWKVELIKPVSEMLEYLQSDVDLKNGYHLADMLMKTCYVAGDKRIYDEFDHGTVYYMTQPTKLDKGLLKKYNPDLTLFTDNPTFHNQLFEDIDRFSALQIASDQQPRGEINVKRTVYRPATLFLAALSRFNKIKSKSSFNQVRELTRKGMISDSMCGDLLFVLAIACEVRLKVYFQNKGQKDTLVQYSEMTQGSWVSTLEKMVGVQSYLTFAKVVTRIERIVISDLQYQSYPHERILAPFMLAFRFLDLNDIAKADLTFASIYNNLTDGHKRAYALLTGGVGDQMSAPMQTGSAMVAYQLMKGKGPRHHHSQADRNDLIGMTRYTADEPQIQMLEDTIRFT